LRPCLPGWSMMHTMSMSAEALPEGPADRTTVSLPLSVSRRLRAEAQMSRRSVSAIVREALEEYLGGRAQPELPSFAAVGNSGIGDLSERVEDLLSEAMERPE